MNLEERKKQPKLFQKIEDIVKCGIPFSLRPEFWSLLAKSESQKRDFESSWSLHEKVEQYNLKQNYQ